MGSSGSSNVESGRDGSGPKRRTLIGVAAVFLVAVVGVFAFSYMQRLSKQREQIQLWPVGTVQDIEDLASREKVNVLFILVDTLRADRMSAYGYERETTPVLKYLADTGIRFADHHSQSSWTKASMASAD